MMSEQLSSFRLNLVTWPYLSALLAKDSLSSLHKQHFLVLHCNTSPTSSDLGPQVLVLQNLQSFIPGLSKTTSALPGNSRFALRNKILKQYSRLQMLVQ